MKRKLEDDARDGASKVRAVAFVASGAAGPATSSPASAVEDGKRDPRALKVSTTAVFALNPLQSK